MKENSDCEYGKRLVIAGDGPQRLHSCVALRNMARKKDRGCEIVEERNMHPFNIYPHRLPVIAIFYKLVSEIYFVEDLHRDIEVSCETSRPGFGSFLRITKRPNLDVYYTAWSSLIAIGGPFPNG